MCRRVVFDAVASVDAAIPLRNWSQLLGFDCGAAKRRFMHCVAVQEWCNAFSQQCPVSFC